jgi:drug/metabolite transporter (DMT)-like permease
MITSPAVDKARLAGILSGLAAAAIWGGMYVVSDVVLETVPPFTLLNLRLLLGVATWGLVIALRGTRPRWGRLRPSLFAGFVGYGVSLGLQFVGTKLSTAANGALITSATPAFVAVFAAGLLREKLTPHNLAALGIASLGVLLVLAPSRAQFSAGLFWGNLALLGAAVAWALYSVLVRRLTQGGAELVPVTVLMLFGAFPLTLPAAGVELLAGGLGELTGGICLGILYLGVISTALAMYLWNSAFARLEAGAASLTFFAQPVTGVALSALLGEAITPVFLWGGILIGVGLWLSARQA